MPGKTIVTLGGGIGGVVAVNELRRLLPGENRIILVERDPYHVFAPSFLWLMTGERRPEQIRRDIKSMLLPGIELELTEAQAVDMGNHHVQTSTRKLPYDYLVVALGAELAPETIPGLLESAQTFYTFDGALKLHDALKSFPGGRVAVVVSALPYKCPGAPHEGAMLITDFFRKRGQSQKVEVHLFTPEPQPMPVAGPALGEAVRQMLDNNGVAFHALHKLTKVDTDARELYFEGKDAFQYDLLVAIPPHRGARVAREAGLTNEAGWIPVNRLTLQTQYEGVYALGDATAISIPGRWKPDVPLMLPKAGVFAHAQAKVVAQRITAEIAGRGKPSEFPGVGYCMLEAGESMAGFAFGDFFAEPSPQIDLRQIGKTWHLGKVLFEQWWLAPHGLRREALQLALTLGGKVLGIPIIM
jgi:sulfide:quinone oxidoreductase